jgi:hypothetical protein
MSIKIVKKKPSPGFITSESVRSNLTTETMNGNQAFDEEDMQEIFENNSRLNFEQFAEVCFGGKLTQVDDPPDRRT